jgi:hypothetical protein
VDVARIVRWPDQDCRGAPDVVGPPLPDSGLDQAPPRNAALPRLDSRRAARRLAAVPHRLLGFVAADSFPIVVPVTVLAAHAGGLTLRTESSLLPPRGIRAGLLGHRFYEHVAGLTSRQYTGWMTVRRPGTTGFYAPHTERGLVLPHSKTLALLVNGMVATITYRQAQKAGRQSLLDAG